MNSLILELQGKMSDYIKKNENYIQTMGKDFEFLSQYNRTIISFGFAGFFAMATFVKGNIDDKIFIISIISMSLSMFLFVLHELFRALYYIRYTSNKAAAIEKLPDNNPLKIIESEHNIVQIRMFKWNKWFFYPSIVLGFIGVGL